LDLDNCVSTTSFIHKHTLIVDKIGNVAKIHALFSKLSHERSIDHNSIPIAFKGFRVQGGQT
jgi:hypothetical protein